MKLQIHPFSALAGAGLLGLVLIASGAAQGHGPVRVRIVNPVEVGGIATPQAIFTVLEKNISPEIGLPPYMVPAGKLLVITAVGTTGGSVCRILVDGAEVYRGGGPQRIDPVPPHLTATAGSEVEVGDNNGGTQTGLMWAYLVEL